MHLSVDLLAVLVAILAVIATSLIEVTMLYRMYTNMSADDVALFLQGWRIQEVLERIQENQERAQ
jgi:hypothetical protein